ncbi:FHA domain-containing protein [Nocardioides furvisabuli]|uniref:FHA domain-containing protein n=1 Tax=Nocardioides furvisabuli TaxID=375542 RepID=UPI0031DB34F9
MTSGATVAVTEVAPGTADALWTLLGTTPDVVGVLDVLGAAGIASMPEFAAVVVTEEHLRVVVRGRFVVAVDVAGTALVCDAAGAATWSERAFAASQVSGWRLAHADVGATDERLPLVGGVVRAGLVASGEVSVALAGDEERPTAPPAPEPEPESKPESEPVPEPEPQPEPEPDDSATLVDPSEDVYDAMFGATVAGRTPDDAAVRDLDDSVRQVAAPPGAGPVPSQAEDRTISPAEFAALRAARLDEAPVADGPRLVLRFPHGREERVDGLVVIGRSPRAVNAASADITLVVLDDPYISGTHLEVALVGGRTVATDHSSNGTLMEAPGRAGQLLTKGLAMELSAGMTLRLSDALVIEVAPA